MSVVKHAIHEHDVVALCRPVDKVEGPGQWPAGTIGAVVGEHGEHKLIEIADDRGVTLDLLSQPESQLELISKHSRQPANP
jgi:hypothetical protein